MELLYFTLAAYGLTQILVYGSILKRIRPKTGKLGELFSFDVSAVNILIFGCISSGTSYILNMLFGDEGLKIEVNNE